MRSLMRPAALVANYFDTLSPAQVPTARALQQRLLMIAPELEQAVKWGNLCFMSQGRVLMAIVAHKAHAHLQFFNGALLAQDFKELEGVGHGVRHIKQRYSQPIDVDLITDLVHAAMALGPRAAPTEGSERG